MSTSDNYVTSRQIMSNIPNESTDSNMKTEDAHSDIKIQEVGCCGDVPKISKANNKKRDKLLEWLKSSQLKREENNRQVFSRWIDMVDNGAIDLTSLSNYPGKPSKSNNQFTNSGSTVTTITSEIPLSQINSNASVGSPISKPLPSNAVKTSTIPTASMCPQYFSSVNTPNYYGITPNWFATNQPTIYSPMSLAQPQPMGMYSGSFCTSNPMLSNYYQYLPVQQSCSMCPSYVVPNVNSNIDNGCNLSSNHGHLTSTENASTVNMDANKWFEVLNDIKLNAPRANKCDDGSLNLVDRDCKDDS